MSAPMVESGLIVEHPNRETAAARATRAIVVGLLLASAAILALATVGGWSKIQGAKVLQIAFVVVYLVLALYIARWRSGLLPVAASLAVILLIFCAISGPGWFVRDRSGFEDPLFDESVVGLLTIVLVPLQVLLIAAAARGFAQKWSVEVERPARGTPPYVAQAG